MGKEFRGINVKDKLGKLWEILSILPAVILFVFSIIAGIVVLPHAAYFLWMLDW